MYFTNQDHIFYFIPLESETDDNFYKILSNAKKGYQFYSFIPSLDDSIKHNVKLGYSIDGNHFKNSITKDSILFCPTKVNFDYALNKAYEPEMTIFKQGGINLNFRCYYIEDVNFKFYYMGNDLKK